MNYALRQQYRRLLHAGKAALGSVVAGLLGLVVASSEATALGGLLPLPAVALGLYARHWLSLARRSRVGARSGSSCLNVSAISPAYPIPIQSQDAGSSWANGSSVGSQQIDVAGRRIGR